MFPLLFFAKPCSFRDVSESEEAASPFGANYQQSACAFKEAVFWTFVSLISLLFMHGEFRPYV